MKRAQETLTRAAHKLAEVMYQSQAQPGAPTGGPSPDGRTAGPKEGEVVDAEFEDLGEKK
jgi:hypothetical protein